MIYAAKRERDIYGEMGGISVAKRLGGAASDMRRAEPIRDKAKIERMKLFLLKQSYRDYILFLTGINSWIRFPELIRLKAGDLRASFAEQGGKALIVDLSIRQELENYIVDLKDEDYLFRSREGENRPITRRHAYRVLNVAAEKAGVENIGVHTLRKTFGYHHYLENRDIGLLQRLFNHPTQKATVNYLGLREELAGMGRQDKKEPQDKTELQDRIRPQDRDKEKEQLYLVEPEHPDETYDRGDMKKSVKTKGRDRLKEHDEIQKSKKLKGIDKPSAKKEAVRKRDEAQESEERSEKAIKTFLL